MDDRAVPIKTDAGWTEVSQRQRKLGARQRVLLIAVHGGSSVAELRQQFQSLGDVGAMLDELAGAGLIRISLPGAPVASPQSAPPTAAQGAAAVPLARQFMNDCVVAHLGLRAFLFTLKIERCYDKVSLQGLLPEFAQALGKKLDAGAVAVYVRRAEALIAVI